VQDGKESRLELGGGEINAILQHFLKNFANRILSATLTVFQSIGLVSLKNVVNIVPTRVCWMGIPACFAAEAIPASNWLAAWSRLSQQSSDRINSNAASPALIAKGIARQGARLIHGTGGRDQLHDLALPTIRTDREPTADHFAQRGQVRLDIIERLRAALVDAEARHDFVEDKQAAFARSNCTQSFKKPWQRRDNTHVPGDWFDNDGCNLFGIFFIQGFHRFEIIEICD
jgi:hypothetical protein